MSNALLGLSSEPQTQYGLSGDEMGRIFPFHLVIDRDLKVVQIGPVLRRFVPEEALGGGAFFESFHVVRPSVPQTFAALSSKSGMLFMVVVRGWPLQLKGQMIYQPESETLCFIGSPWVTDLASLKEAGVVLKDFPLHDSLSDYLVMLQSKNAVLTDNRSLIANLHQQQKDLQDLSASLEAKVAERTAQLERAKEKIEEAHRQTQDSIAYASMIQCAFVPDDLEIKRHYQDCFSIWFPKDIVGGDIYLFEQFDDGQQSLLMVIDCTGHGVPGAFVTMLVKALERQLISSIVNHPELEVSPAALLEGFHQGMKTLLQQEFDCGANIGFDGGILYTNRRTGILRYSGATTPLFVVEDGVVAVLRGRRSSVGYCRSCVQSGFSDEEIALRSGMQIYLTTDGLLDQNGGAHGFPFGRSRFCQFLTDHAHLPFPAQKKQLLACLEDYQGAEERNDDLTVVALKV